MTHVSRRRFLQLTALGATASAVPLVRALADDALGHSPARRAPLPDAESASATGAVVAGDGLLIVIELTGGHDGFSTIVPSTDPSYRAARPRTIVEDTLAIGDGFGWHPALAPLVSRPDVGAVLGVGVEHPDLSHFEMMQRWWAGSPSDGAGVTTGFLGRLADAVDAGGAPATGVSIGDGPSPALQSERAATLFVGPWSDTTMPTPGDGGPGDSAWLAAQHALARGGTGLERAARGGIGAALEFAAAVDGLAETDTAYPEHDLGTRLRTAARLLTAGVGVRIVHVPWGAFDTHSDHLGAHANLMDQLGTGLAALLDDLDARGLGDRALVVTTSEFGRRLQDNESNGLDHGTASNLLVAGGRRKRTTLQGEPVDLARLDDDGNVRATVSMSAYYATAARWLGVEPGRVLSAEADTGPGWS